MRLLIFLGLLCVTTCATLFGQEVAMAQDNFLPISVWYSGGKARAPMLSPITDGSAKEWKKDLEQIKQLGFNTVRTWVEWAHGEPRRGEYHFENLNLLCKLAEEVGLRVFIQMYVDSAPDWVGRAYPDALFEAQSGEKVPSQAAPGFCTDHAGVREAVLNFYREAARQAIQYQSFYGWDLWSEPHIINWAIIRYVPNAQFCFCPHTRSRFRQWLQKKYRSLEELNKAWYRNFASWDEVDPPRFGTILSYTDYIDWKMFIFDKLAGDLRMRHDAIREVDKTHVITSHSAVPSLFTTPHFGDGASDDFLMAGQVDHYGTSIYPKHSFPDHHWSQLMIRAAMDFSRSVNRQNDGFYIGELQAGYGTRGVVVGNPVTASDLRLWMWSALARRVRGINLYAYYPMSSGYEAGGYGLIHLDGTLTERAEEAGKIPRLVTEQRQLFLSSRPVQAQIAIVYNPLAQLVGGEQHSGSLNALTESLMGYYQVFADHNIPVDFIHRHALEQGELSEYRLLIVPYPIMFSREAAEGLKKFVAEGGYAVAEARLGWNDERGFAAEVIPGMGLSEVFGVRETRVKMEEKVEMQLTEHSHPATQKLVAGEFLLGASFAEVVQPLPEARDVHILARLADGSPALVASSYGKGATLFIGSFLGLAQKKSPEATNERFILGLVEWAKVERPFESSHDGRRETPVEIRAHEGPEGKLLFVLNRSDVTQKPFVNLRVEAEGDYTVRNLMTKSSSTVTSKGRTLGLAVQVLAEDAVVLHVARAP